MSHRTLNGTWRVRWFDKSWHSRTFERKVDAEKFEAEVRSGLVKIPVKSGLTFELFALQWHKDYCMVNKSESQWYEDTRLIKNYLNPFFGRKQIEDLKLRDLVSFQASLKRLNRLNPKTINLITGLARKILEDAVSWEYLPTNPFRLLKKLPIAERECSFWNFEERDRFLNYCKHEDHELFEYIVFAVHTGCRLGEAIGLYRDCIDFERREITIKRSFSMKLKKLFDTTKSKRIRRLPMNEQVYEILKSKRLLAPTQKVFSMSFNNLKRRFMNMCRKAEVKVIRIHDLRHSFASQLALSGVPIIIIKELLGHADIKMTMRYAHLAPESLKGITDVLVTSDRTKKVCKSDSKFSLG